MYTNQAGVTYKNLLMDGFKLQSLGCYFCAREAFPGFGLDLPQGICNYKEYCNYFYLN